MTTFKNYFYGNEISDYGKENGFVDYRTFSKAFEAVLANGLIEATEGVCGYWEQESGFADEADEIDNPPEIFQYYIIDENGARICEEFNEIVFYNSDLDLYLWGVTHFGTAWDYVLTNIPCEKIA